MSLTFINNNQLRSTRYGSTGEMTEWMGGNKKTVKIYFINNLPKSAILPTWHPPLSSTRQSFAPVLIVTVIFECPLHRGINVFFPVTIDGTKKYGSFRHKGSR